MTCGTSRIVSKLPTFMNGNLYDFLPSFFHPALSNYFAVTASAEHSRKFFKENGPPLHSMRNAGNSALPPSMLPGRFVARLLFPSFLPLLLLGIFSSVRHRNTLPSQVSNFRVQRQNTSRGNSVCLAWYGLRERNLARSR